MADIQTLYKTFNANLNRDLRILTLTDYKGTAVYDIFLVDGVYILTGQEDDEVRNINKSVKVIVNDLLEATGVYQFPKFPRG